MHTVFVEVKPPISCKGAGALTREHLIYPVTIKTGTESYAASRRYTDFEAFRIRLTSSHWCCIVPPLPEKEGVLDNLGIGEDPDHRTKVGQTRRKEFQQFLKDVYEHPILRTDALLLKFMNEEEWRKLIREPFAPPPFLDSTSVSSIAQQLIKKATFQQEQTSQDHVAIDVQRRHIDSLRKQFQAAISYRKESALALKLFGEDLEHLGEGETSENHRRIVTSIDSAAKEIAQHKEKRSSDEEELLATLNYGYNMCGAVLETMKNIASARNYLEQLVQRVEAMKNAPSKANLDAHGVGALEAMVKEKDYLSPIVKDAETTFKKRFKVFQEEMTKMLNIFVIRFSEIQSQHTESVLQTAQGTEIDVS